MDSTAHWPQGIGVVKPMEASSKQANNNNNNSNNMLDQRSRARPQKDQALNCPRCNSTNTKFCYYNNYSLTQPRYFCKTCRRYWTEGGSLRNVPVGGGSRKNKRSSSSTATTTITSSSSNSLLPISSAPKKLNVDHHHIIPPPSLNFPPDQNPKIHHAQDLNLAYPPTSSHHDHHHHHHNSISTSFVELPYNSTTSIDHNKISHTQNPSTTMELLKTAASRDLGSGLIGSFMSMPVNNPDHHNSNTMFSTGFHNLAQEFKPSLSFGLDHHHHHHGYNMDDHQDGNLHGVQESSTTGVRLLFPSTDDQDLKQVSSTTTTTNTHDHHHHHHQQQQQHQHHQFELNIKGQGDISNGYNWNGMLGHGGSW